MKIMNNKLSVIIPIYNSGLYLEQCLDSVINQSYKNLEVICINDGSTDNSLEILTKYSKKDKRIKIYSQKNMGGNVALNNGIKYSTGQYIHFLDSDDYLDLNAYKRILEAVESDYEIDLCLFYYYKIDKNCNVINKISSPFNKNVITSFKENPKLLIDFYSAQWGKLYKSDLIKNNNIKFDNTLFGYDMIFHLNCIKHSNKISVLNESFVYYRSDNPNSNAGSFTRAKNYNIHFDCYNNCINLYKDQNSEIQSYNIRRQFRVNCNYLNLDKSCYKMKNYLMLRSFIQNLDKKTIKVLKKERKTRYLLSKIIRFDYKRNDIYSLNLNYCVNKNKGFFNRICCYYKRLFERRK